MTTQSKRTPFITTDVFQTVLTLNFSNGQSLEIDTNTLTEEIKLQAMLHGLKQKLVDSAAIGCDTTTGKSASIEDKFQAVKTTYDRITSPNGTWNQIREGTPKAQGGMLVRAMMELSGKSKQEIDEWLAAKSKEEIAALRTSPKILPIIHRLELEAAQAKTKAIDSEALLESLF